MFQKITSIKHVSGLILETMFSVQVVDHWQKLNHKISKISDFLLSQEKLNSTYYRSKFNLLASQILQNMFYFNNKYVRMCSLCVVCECVCIFSLFMNDLPRYFRTNHCPGIMLENQSLNCLMHADDPLHRDYSNRLMLLKKHAEEWNLKVNTKKSNIIIFSGNGQNKNKENFKHGNKPLHIIDEQTYLGDRKWLHLVAYTYVQDILCKKAYKVLSNIKWSFSNSDTTNY